MSAIVCVQVSFVGVKWYRQADFAEEHVSSCESVANDHAKAWTLTH